MIARRPIIHRLEKHLGHVAVAALLGLALVASYACGGEEQPVTKEIGTVDAQTRPGTATARVTQAASVSEASPRPPSVAEPIERRVVTYEEAETAFHERNYAEATDLFLVYTSDKPDNVWGHYMLGLSAWKAGVLPQAESSFERALEIDSAHAKSLINLTRVLLEMERPREAVERIERLLEIDPESGPGHRLLGNAYAQLGDIEAARESYWAAITVDEEDAWSMNNLGLLLIRQADYKRAVPPLARAVEIRNDVAVFHNNLGIALERQGYWENAVHAFRRALELDGGYEKAQTNLTRVESRPDLSTIKAIDLTVFAQEFQSEIEASRAPTLDLPSVDSLPSGGRVRSR